MDQNPKQDSEQPLGYVERGLGSELLGERLGDGYWDEDGVFVSTGSPELIAALEASINAPVKPGAEERARRWARLMRIARGNNQSAQRHGEADDATVV